MATDVERLIVRLEVSQARFERQMANMSNVANRRAREVENRFSAMNRNIQRQLEGVGSRALGAGLGLFAGAVSLRGAQQLIDASTRIDNALKVAGLSGQELTKVYDQLFASAQANSAPIESLVTLYGRVAIVQNELGVSSAELLSFTNNVALALRVAGTDAQSASGALLQLSQAMGAGVVRAEEFNSILEGALPVAQAAAAGLEEAGGSVARLRQLVIDGEVSSEAFFRAFEAGSVILEDKVAGAESTVSQAFVRLQNVLIDTAGKIDESSDAGASMAEVLDTLAAYIASTDFSPLINGVIDFGAAVIGVLGQVQALGEAIGNLTGATAIGPALLGNRTQAGIQDRINGAFEATAGTGAPGEGAPATVVTVDRPITPVSLRDYAAPTKPGKGGAKGRAGGGRGRRGGGGGSRGSDQAFERESEQIRERTAAIQAETAAMAALNPTIEDYNFTLEKTRAEQDLLNAANKAGIGITPQLREQIATLATGYATASAEANKLSDSQDEIRQRSEDMRALGKDVMGGFIDDMKGGIDAAEALANALEKVGSRLLDIALDGLFSPKDGGGSGGGLLGGIGKVLGFSKGTANTGGRRGEARGVVHGQEAVIPLPNGGRVPVDVRLPVAAGRGNASSATYHIDARGAQQGVGEEIASALAAYDKQRRRGLGQEIAQARTKNRAGFR